MVWLRYLEIIGYKFWMRAEGQADSIVEDIENMVRSYVEKVYNMLHYDVGFNFFFSKYETQNYMEHHPCKLNVAMVPLRNIIAWYFTSRNLQGYN